MTDYEMGSKSIISMRLWDSPDAGIYIARARRMMHSALTSAGVETVHQHAPFHVDAYRDEETGVLYEEHWELNASGISLCRRDGHSPYDDGFRDFMCSRCGEIVDRAAYEAIAGVTP